MSLYIASLNSGSNGNCYYVGTDTDAVLIDAGISCRETEIRMKRLGLNIKNVRALFISHEHTDHVRGMQTLANKHSILTYITQATLQNSRMRIAPELIRIFVQHEPVQAGGLSVTPFPKQHDAVDPYSFTIEGNETTVGVFTDIGIACEHLIANFRKCHAAFLEANYDEMMLEQGNYPPHLKKRIRGGKGHLSNREALELVTRHKPEFMSHLLLAHLSKNNNKPEIVRALFSCFADEMEVVVTSRYEASAVYHVNGSNSNTIPFRNKVIQAQLF